MLEHTFGSWARSIAIQYDLFACTPLLLSVGILLARNYGNHEETEPVWQTLLKVPPLWAALAAIGLNLGEVAVFFKVVPVLLIQLALMPLLVWGWAELSA